MTLQVRRCVVNDTILLVMSISRWLGLAPVGFTKSRDKKVMYISRTFVIYGLIFLIVFGQYNFFYLFISFTLYPAHDREPSVKTLCFPLSSEFWSHCAC